MRLLAVPRPMLWKRTALITFSSLVSETFGDLLGFLSDRTAFVCVVELPSTSADNTVFTGKLERKPLDSKA